MGGMFFPDIFYVAEPFNVRHSNIVVLFGYKPSKQVEVVEKI